MHLIADIGGTNIRLAAFEGEPLTAFKKLMAGGYDQVCVYEWAQVGGLAEAIVDFKAQLGLSGKAASLTMAIAGIALMDQENFDFTNQDATFRRSDLLAFADKVEVINDFAAQASSIPYLGDTHFQQLKPGTAARGARAVIGPGTGLGIAGLTPHGAVIPGEGGNVAVGYLSHAPLKEIGANLGKGQIRAEDVFSGQGLENIYEAQTGVRLSAKDISARAHEGHGRAIAAFDMFFDYAAQICANQALQYVAVGGVYLVGAIMIKNVDLMDRERFRRVFSSTQTHVQFLESVPVYMVTSPTSGLAGVAAHLAA